MKSIFQFLIIVGITASCGSNTESSESSSDQVSDLRPEAQENFEAMDLTGVPDRNDPKVLLGKRLFFDPQLSKTGKVSCNSCHDMKTFGVDNKAFSDGIEGHITKRNSPTVFNSSGQVAQFWDGRAKTLRDQVRMPIMTIEEMGMTEELLLERLRANALYVKSFNEAFSKEDITIDDMAEALASFIESETYLSKFDKYLTGKLDLQPIELQGLRSFIDKGCTDCHDGSLIGGDDFEKFGIFKNYWELTKSKSLDSGRYLVTGDAEDIFVFKIPSLRNVAKTGPYFHDGSVAKLEEAIIIMGQVQLNETIEKEEAKKIAAFLSTLTSEIPKTSISMR